MRPDVPRGGLASARHVTDRQGLISTDALSSLLSASHLLSPADLAGGLMVVRWWSPAPGQQSGAVQDLSGHGP